MTDKTLLIIGNDKISARVLAVLPTDPNLVVVLDRSTSAGRVLRLLGRGSLSVWLLVRMLWCELRRRAVPARSADASITCNADVVRLIERYAPQRVVLFRAGLIINRMVLATGAQIMNIHCARIPEFGGIGSIDRALRAGVYEQFATLHQVTDAIDSGVVFGTEPYELDPALGYCANEDRAYAAGQRLLLRTLQQPQQPMVPPA
jgi:hypothetical protein